MSDKIQLVTEGSFSNQQAGQTVRGQWQPDRNPDGSIRYTNTVKLSTTQVDCQFPLVITSDRMAAAAKATKVANGSPLLTSGTDYRLSGEPTELPADEDNGLPAVMIATYKPVRQSVTF